jgi:hypothetical protein
MAFDGLHVVSYLSKMGFLLKHYILGPSPLASKACGTTSCSSSDIDITALAATARSILGTPCIEACCTADNKCGASAKITAYTPGIGLMVIVATTCTERDQPGIESEACPKFFETFESVIEDAGPMNWDSLESLDFAGCCRSDGTCGYLVSMTGLGCASVADTRHAILCRFDRCGRKNVHTVVPIERFRPGLSEL